MMNMIEFAVQSSGGGSGVLISPLHVMLNQIFSDDSKKSVFLDKSLPDSAKKLQEFSIIFRVAGGDRDFDGGDGPERLKKVRGENCITIDYVIPEAKWQSYMTPVRARLCPDRIIRWEATEEEEYKFRLYISDAVKECYELLKVRAKKLKYEFNEKKLDEYFDQGIKMFLTKELPVLPK